MYFVYVVEVRLKIYEIENELVDRIARMYIWDKDSAIVRTSEMLQYDYDSVKCYRVKEEEAVRQIGEEPTNNTEIYIGGAKGFIPFVS